MRFRRIIIVLLVLLSGFNVVLACDDSRKIGKENMRIAISDFNRMLFLEMNPARAIRKYYFMGSVDSADRKFGVENDFLAITKRAPEKDKLRYFIQDFEWEFAMPLLRWRLGTKTVTKKSVFSDGQIIEDKRLVILWERELKKLGLTEESIDDKDTLDANALDLHEKLLTNLTSAIARNIDKRLLAKNLRIINQNTGITSEVVEGKTYFIVKSKLFIYKVAIKDCLPKIMYMNRNYSNAV